MARKGNASDAESRANAGDGDEPPGRLRLKLKTMDDVKAEMARLYRECKSGRRDVADGSKLANMLSLLGRLIEGADFEARLQAIEVAQQQPKKAGSAWSSAH